MSGEKGHILVVSFIDNCNSGLFTHQVLLMSDNFETTIARIRAFGRGFQVCGTTAKYLFLPHRSIPSREAISDIVVPRLTHVEDLDLIPVISWTAPLYRSGSPTIVTLL